MTKFAVGLVLLIALISVGVAIAAGWLEHQGARILPANQGTFVRTGRMDVWRENPTATLLLDGTVLVVDGYSTCCVSGHPRNPRSGSADAQVWDPATGEFSQTGKPLYVRDGHTATRLK